MCYLFCRVQTDLMLKRFIMRLEIASKPVRMQSSLEHIVLEFETASQLNINNCLCPPLVQPTGLKRVAAGWLALHKQSPVIRPQQTLPASHGLPKLTPAIHRSRGDSSLSILPESPVEFLLGTTAGRDVYGKEELLEVDEAVLVRVEGAEDVVTELVSVACGEALAIDLHEGGWGEAAVRAITFEAFVPLFDRVLVITGAGLKELQVLLG